MIILEYNMLKKYIMFCLLFTLISCNSKDNRTYPESEINFTIVQTTDIHGMIFPYNFITDEEENTSMAQVNTYIKKLKDEGKTILLLDNGDSLQGQPTVYYYNLFRGSLRFIIITLLPLMSLIYGQKYLTI